MRQTLACVSQRTPRYLPRQHTSRPHTPVTLKFSFPSMHSTAQDTRVPLYSGTQSLIQKQTHCHYGKQPPANSHHFVTNELRQMSCPESRKSSEGTLPWESVPTLGYVLLPVTLWEVSECLSPSYEHLFLLNHHTQICTEIILLNGNSESETLN